MKYFLIVFLFSLTINSTLKAQSNEDSLGVKKDTIKYQIYKISETENYQYRKLKISDLYKTIPKNILNTAKDMVSKEVYPYSIAAVGATAALVPVDPFLTRNARSFGKQIGFEYDHSYRHQFAPANVNTALYFMGNGTAVVLMGVGFASYGFIAKDYRAQSVSAQLVQSIIVSGVFSQTLKRITGRESPFITTQEGRENSSWHFFPSFAAYQKDTSRYDAVPSGHLTTGLAAWTVIAENYPEYKWIRPVGYTVLGLMCFEMVQSGVHWTSDYPIAILFGYLIGKNIAKSAIKKETTTNLSDYRTKYKLNFSSSSLGGIQTFGVNVVF